MSYNRVRTPKFYIDAVLLARQLGYIQQENAQGKFYLNPTKTTDLVFSSDGNPMYIYIDFKNRYFLNSLTHCFILGHQLETDNIEVGAMSETEHIDNNWNTHNHTGNIQPTTNGWTKLDNFVQDTSMDLKRFVIELQGASQSTPIGDISIGWSYQMPHSPDMELTQTFGNESLKTQTTKGGHTLTNTGWNQPPMWGNYPQWAATEDFISYPTRRSWNLKFSYVSDIDLMPSYFNELALTNYGMFIGTAQVGFGVNSSFLARVMPTINLGLPFIFQPDSTVEEYAIARVNANSVTMNQVANNVYDISMSITETF